MLTAPTQDCFNDNSTRNAWKGVESLFDWWGHNNTDFTVARPRKIHHWVWEMKRVPHCLSTQGKVQSHKQNCRLTLLSLDVCSMWVKHQVVWTRTAVASDHHCSVFWHMNRSSLRYHYTKKKNWGTRSLWFHLLMAYRNDFLSLLLYCSEMSHDSVYIQHLPYVYYLPCIYYSFSNYWDMKYEATWGSLVQFKNFSGDVQVLGAGTNCFSRGCLSRKTILFIEY